MTDLVEFLRARLDEDEQVARACWAYDWATGNDRGDRTVTDVETGTFVCWLSGNDPAGAAHIARHDPARVLREVEAKRQIVDYESDGHLRGLHIDAWGIWRDQLKLLALPYADHPDYQQEWKLSTS